MVVLSWPDLAARLPSAAPPLIDSALAPDEPALDGTLTLFRERHGWCPYSERVWLALEAKGIEHTTVLIDNTGHGRRPSWYSGTTPQIRWADGKTQGESLDLVRELDVRFPATPPLFEASGVDAAISAFRRCFPRNARPSSRAAYLFSYDGPLPRSTFEAALDATDAALGETGGPFFCGDAFSAADVAWAPFLERYAAQLPCLHDGLAPRSARWPRLEAWYSAMDGVPAYAARVQGHPDSWRKVLAMQGYGNAGAPSDAHRRRRRPRVGAAGRRRLGRVRGEPAARRGDAGGGGGGDDRAQPRRDRRRRREARARGRCGGWRAARRRRRAVGRRRRGGRRGGGGGAGGAPGRADVRAARHGAAAGVGAAAGRGGAGRF